jgi:hypothetical protein
VYTIGILEDRYGERNLAVGCRRQQKKWTKCGSGSRQKMANARGRLTSCVVPALCNGRSRGEPGKTSGNGIRGRSRRQELRLRIKPTFYKAPRTNHRTGDGEAKSGLVSAFQKEESRPCGGAGHRPSGRRDCTQLKSRRCRSTGHFRKCRSHGSEKEKWRYALDSGRAALRRVKCGMSAESQNCEASRDSRY